MESPESVENIYNSWNPDEGGFEGSCSECPVRDERGCRSPFYGHGTFNEHDEVDIMLIGEAPGPASQEDGANPSISEIPEFSSKRTEKISAAFGENSPHLHSFTDKLQDKYDVYYTNLLKCNKLAVPGDGDSWIPVKVINEQSESVADHSDLNENAKEICRDYLVSEIFSLSPEVIIPFGGKKMVKEVYELFGMSVPTLKHPINNRRSYEVELNPEEHSGSYSGKLIPSYHFSENRFKNRVTNVTTVSNDSVDKVRDEYWAAIHQIIEQEMS